ncbi:MAG: hypothetical protein KKD73_10635 [Proteobacteria bacterium]|nr:hypothetical protein [Pseudomonadota bacterium]MBU1638850.1 hypothetical protein [Pseudomonadota bacterium]
MAGRALAELQPQFPDLDFIKVDATLHPQQTWRAGVRMIPCLRADDTYLSGIMLSKAKIRSFLEHL